MKFDELVLGEALEFLIDNRGKNPPYSSTGIPVVSGMSVRPNGLDLSESKFVTAETWKGWMPNPTKRDDVILTSEAPLGRVALLRSDEPMVIAQRVFGLRGRIGTLDSRFLYYALQTARVQADLSSRATGSTVLGIRQPELRKVLIPAPTFDQQLAIAGVLGAFDDKIASNTRVISGALRLIDAVFQKARSCCALIDSTYANVAQIRGGGTPRTSVDAYWGGDVPWATPTDVTNLSAPYIDSTGRTITDAGLAATSSELYPAGSILMTSRATIGAFAIAQVPIAVNQGFIVVNAKNPELQWWLFHDMRARVSEFLSYANGATFLELSKGKFKQIPVAVPSLDVGAEFAAQASALHGVASAAAVENVELARTRDELLPLLMSGRIRVKDAESRVSEVV